MVTSPSPTVLKRWIGLELRRLRTAAGRVAPRDSAAAKAAGRAQLNPRHRLAALVADEYATAGITAVVQDLYLGDDLSHFLGLLRHRPIYLTVLAPRLNVIAWRERARRKTGFGQWSIAAFDTLLRELTPQLGSGWTIQTSAWRRRSTPS